jgi:hypothetical protein
VEIDLDLDDVKFLIEMPNIKPATVGRVFELLVQNFLEEYGTLEAFLVSRRSDQSYCFQQLLELEKNHQDKDHDFSLAVKLFSYYLKASISENEDFSQGLMKTLQTRANLANSTTFNQLLGALL